MAALQLLSWILAKAANKHTHAGPGLLGHAARIHSRCFATLLFKDTNLTTMRRAFEADEAMVKLWASRLLNVTWLPIFVMHAHVDASALLKPIDPQQRLHYFPVNIVNGGYWGGWPWYRNMHTKLHTWALPCKRAAFLDYDGLPLRNLDSVFDECPHTADLCATQDHVTPKKKGLRVPNAGMLVVKPRAATHSAIIASAEKEAVSHTRRMLAEQGFLNSYFPQWFKLPDGYNIPHHISRSAHNPQSAKFKEFRAYISKNTSYFLHEKLDLMPRAVAIALGALQEYEALGRLRLTCVQTGEVRRCGLPISKH